MNGQISSADKYIGQLPSKGIFDILSFLGQILCLIVAKIDGKISSADKYYDVGQLLSESDV